MSQISETQIYCPNCDRYVLGRRVENPPSVLGDLFVIAFTFGLALPLVVLRHMSVGDPYRCTVCGSADRNVTPGGWADVLLVVVLAAVIGAGAWWYTTGHLPFLR